MPKYNHKKPDRPANLPDEPVESLEKQYYTAPTRVWFVRKDEIGKEGVIVWRTGTVSNTTQSTILHRVCHRSCFRYLGCPVIDLTKMSGQIIDDETGAIEDISVEYIRMIK
ncbi:MAG: hypothetical protein LQ339_007205 [Xanthoria mediterranea]|nr:MAG: hypothetical protein LQ339_007205 [Xanthoria mediterranea]